MTRTSSDDTPTIGISGHRSISLESRKFLKKAIHDIMLAQGSNFTALSPLALGADTIFATEALEFGAQLIAPLPFSPSIYRNTISLSNDPEQITNLRNFDSLLSSSQIHTVTLPEDKGLSDIELANLHEADFKDQVRRDLRYRASGEYVVNNSDLMIIACEDRPSPNPTHPGTAAIWAYAVNLGGPVIHIPIKRLG